MYMRYDIHVCVNLLVKRFTSTAVYEYENMSLYDYEYEYTYEF